MPLGDDPILDRANRALFQTGRVRILNTGEGHSMNTPIQVPEIGLRITQAVWRGYEETAAANTFVLLIYCSKTSEVQVLSFVVDGHSSQLLCGTRHPCSGMQAGKRLCNGQDKIPAFLQEFRWLLTLI